MPKRIRKPKPYRGRVPMPPPSEYMRDRRLRRPGEDLRRELEAELEAIDEALEEDLDP